jgi:hypothetical protein
VFSFHFEFSGSPAAPENLPMAPRRYRAKANNPYWSSLRKRKERLRNLRRKTPERLYKKEPPKRQRRPRRYRYGVRTDSGPPTAGTVFWVAVGVVPLTISALRRSISWKRRRSAF